MTNEMLRATAKSLFHAGLRAADPTLAVRRELNENPLPKLGEGTLFFVAIGKAACAMIQEALRHTPKGNRINAVAVTNYENACEIDGCKVLAAGHPLPDENGAKAAQYVADLLRQSNAHDHVLAMISGGGSALLPAPVEGVSLDDKVMTSDILLNNGYNITEMNMIRQQLSSLKGGGMLQLAQPASLRGLIISDVIGDDLRTIASGPTVAPIGNTKTARDLINRRGHWNLLPSAVQAQLSGDTSQDFDKVLPEVGNTLICSNRYSLNAIKAAVTDHEALIIDDALDGDVSKAVVKISAQIRAHILSKPLCMIWGGETTVTLKGKGKGGRNQEFALRLAQALSDLSGDWVFLSGGTDGRDGPTDAAGGLVDGDTIKRLRDQGYSPKTFLDQNDSYNALKHSGDLLITGATGTNVADVQIFLYRP